jgi:hypothetical protein
MSKPSKLPWWQTDEYVSDEPVPEAFRRHAGPEGVALVRAWPSGITDSGWGLVPGKDGGTFPGRYKDGAFNERRVVYGFNHERWAFAFVMRSVSMICIDIDGKNGGLEHAKRLGILPVTLAETSKSGDGYHLFYTVDEEWTETGFGLLSDRIGIEQGVDIRATGCVYHYPSQRWNGRQPVPLPEHLYEQLRHREQKIAASQARIQKVLDSDDEMEILMMHDELIAELNKPIPQGKRNNSLFAIGSQMKEARIENWETLVTQRGLDLGLDADELDKLINNIDRYAA